MMPDTLLAACLRTYDEHITAAEIAEHHRRITVARYARAAGRRAAGLRTDMAAREWAYAPERRPHELRAAVDSLAVDTLLVAVAGPEQPAGPATRSGGREPAPRP